jgi:thioredoxin 1|tara:strand:- start:297 stop:566 length:270 start_codon:yes stop_codon:yes gene_type:complete
MIPQEGKVIVDFWAEWCGPCKMMHPILEEYSKEEGAVQVVKVNVDEEADIASKYNIRGIPTFILFEDGEVAKRQTGVMSVQQLKEFQKD